MLAELYPKIPTEKTPLLFYSNQTRQDLKRVFSRSINTAGSSLFLKIYGLTDRTIIDLLSKKAKEGVQTTIFYDPTASPNLSELSSPSLQAAPLKTKGLMHKKILVIDNRLVFLGSANLTSHSLKMHDNLLLGFYSKELAEFLQDPSTFYLNLSFDKQMIHFSAASRQKSSGIRPPH